MCSARGNPLVSNAFRTPYFCLLPSTSQQWSIWHPPDADHDTYHFFLRDPHCLGPCLSIDNYLLCAKRTLNKIWWHRIHACIGCWWMHTSRSKAGTPFHIHIPNNVLENHSWALYMTRMCICTHNGKTDQRFCNCLSLCLYTNFVYKSTSIWSLASHTHQGERRVVCLMSRSSKWESKSIIWHQVIENLVAVQLLWLGSHT